MLLVILEWGNLTTTGNATVSGNLTTTGNATINGNTTLGNAATDTVTVTADVASSLTPSATNTYDLGTSSSEWRNLHIDGTGHIDTIVATEAAVGNLNLATNTLSSTNTNGDIVLNPNGLELLICLLTQQLQARLQAATPLQRLLPLRP